MNYPEQVKSFLLDDIILMSEDPAQFARNPGVDFTRKRKMDFETLIRSIIAMESGTVKHELLKFFDFDSKALSPPAYYQQRCKLLPDAIHYLLKLFLSNFTLELYRGKYQLIASDGSELYISRNPDDLDSYTPPCGMSSRGFNLLHITTLFDLSNRIYLDAVIQPCRVKNEYRALCDLMDSHSNSSAVPIFIADRGFASYNVFAHALEKNQFFLIRAKDINVRRILNLDALPDCIDLNAEIILSRSQAKKSMKRPDLAHCYRYISSEVDFDYILHDSGDEYPMSLRIVRFEVAEGIFENIITNLPPADFPVDEIKLIYGLRWNIEGSFRDLKYAIGVINFHSANRLLIYQEIWARVLLYDFCSIITAHVVIDKKSTKYTYQVNYYMAIKICHHFLRIAPGKDPPDIISLISSYTLPIRPGRSFHRHNRIRRPQSFLYRFS